MQIVGAECKICNTNIMFAADGTWCARCMMAFHRNCLISQKSVCPTCRQPLDAPETHFVFSDFCPECMRPNGPNSRNCSSCGAPTSWDQRCDYDAFARHMRSTSRIYFLRGLGELFLSLLCLLAFIGIFLAAVSASIFLLFALLFGFFTLCVHGTLAMVRSRRIAKFR